MNFFSRQGTQLFVILEFELLVCLLFFNHIPGLADLGRHRKLYLHSSTDLDDLRDEELMTPSVSRESPKPAVFDPVSWFPNLKQAKLGSASQEKCEIVRF